MCSTTPPTPRGDGPVARSASEWPGEAMMTEISTNENCEQRGQRDIPQIADTLARGGRRE